MRYLVQSEVALIMYFLIPDRRTDHATREAIDRQIAELRHTESGLLLYLEITRDHRAHDLLARCATEIEYYAAQGRTLPGAPQSAGKRD